MNSHPLIPPPTGVHHTPHGARRVLGVTMFVAVLGGLPGCSASSSSPAANATTGGRAPASGSAATRASAAATSNTTTGHAAPGGCDLITRQEASAALGSDPGPGMPRSQTQGSVTAHVCNYASSRGGVLSIDAETPTSRAEFDSGRAKLQAAVHGQTVNDLTGVGDAAYASITASGGACVVLKGSVAVNILLLSHASLASPAHTVTTLCKAAAGRL